MKQFLSHDDCVAAATSLVQRHIKGVSLPRTPRLYGVPRGGVAAAYLVAAALNGRCTIAAGAEDADFLVDDIIDSGKTRDRYLSLYPGKPFVALYERGVNINPPDAWVVFPWEVSAESGIEDNIVRLLQFVGEDPTRGGLLETPGRVAKAWSHWCGGYQIKPEDVLKTFEDGANGVDEMITVRDIPFYSHCEHHLAPFFGTATISYIPNGKIVGLSKLSRLLDVYARRLQVQERLTNQVADALTTHLTPKGVGVMVRARHLCMESRGVAKQGHETVTTAVRGAMKENAAARAEFLDAVRG